LPSEPLLQIRGVTRTYQMGDSQVVALDDVCLDISRGEFLAVVGVSGSGKSTLLHLIGGLDTPTAGSVTVDGRALHTLSAYERALYRRRAVGFVFQSFHLVSSMTAEGNIGVALTLQGVYGSERRSRTSEVLARVGLSHRARHRPGELSGGEQQRVALARAIGHRPLILLADEPTGNLDRRTAAEVVELMRSLQRDLETTIIMATHDEETALRVAHRLVRLRDGRIVPAEGGV
jgi:putative ABC transport system ATP-binding protein